MDQIPISQTRLHVGADREEIDLPRLAGNGSLGEHSLIWEHAQLGLREITSELCVHMQA